MISVFVVEFHLICKQVRLLDRELLDNPPFRHAEKANVKIVESLPFRLADLLRPLVGVCERSLLLAFGHAGRVGLARRELRHM